MKVKIALFLSYLFIVFGLVYTDDLIQNNDENLLIEQAKQDKYIVSENDNIIIQFKSPEFKEKHYKEQLDKILKKNFESYQIISSSLLSKTENRNMQLGFYKKFPKLTLKLIQEDSLSFILLIPSHNRKLYPDFFNTLETEFQDYDYSISGLPYLNNEIGKTTLDIKKYILPGLIILTLLISFILFKNIFDTLVFFHFPLISIVFSQLFLKLLFGESNLLSSLAPLVNFVVILSLNFHLFYSLRALQSFDDLKELKAKPILFMLITTVIGIASLSISSVPAINGFAVVSSISLSLSAIYNLLIFRFIYTHRDLKAAQISHFSLTPPKIPRAFVYFSLIVPFVISYFFIRGIPIQVEALYFFPKETKVVVDNKNIEKNVVGSPILEIEFPKVDIKDDYEEFKEVANLEKKISQIIGHETVRLSPSSLIEEANYIFSGQYDLPEVPFQAMRLMSQIPKELLKQSSQSTYKSIFLAKSMDTAEYQELTEQIENLLNKKGITHKLGGLYYRLMKSQTGIIKTLIRSFLISLIFVSILVGFLFKRVKDFLIFLFVNIIPPLLTLSVFKLFSMTLNLATILTFSVSFGLIVDSTIHVIHGQEKGFSMAHMNETVFSPMLLSSFVLMVGFLNFTFHYFLPIWQFGLSMFLTILFGFIYDFFILPNMNTPIQKKPI